MSKIEFSQGDILTSLTQVLVSPVNQMGHDSKGLALLFKQRFPGNHDAYVHDCHSGILVAGGVTFHFDRGKVIANFATKADWRAPSQYEWICAGLRRLRRELYNL